MAAVNTNVAMAEVAPIGGTPQTGWRIGFIDSVAKASLDDTITISNAGAVAGVGSVIMADDSTGVMEAGTISGNVVTLTTAETGATSGLIIYK